MTDVGHGTGPVPRSDDEHPSLRDARELIAESWPSRHEPLARHLLRGLIHRTQVAVADAHPCPKRDGCSLNDGAVTCKSCGRNWPPDETWTVGTRTGPVPRTDGERSLIEGARLRLKVRSQELYEAGATKDQAYFMALEEAWKDEVAENARLWDQAEEISAVQRELSRLRSVIEDAAHFAEMGRDVSVYLRREGLRQELTPSG